MDNTRQADDPEKIFITNLTHDTDEEDLREAFKKFGDIVHMILKTTDEGKCRGFGFIRYSSASEAQDAIDGMNGKVMNGQCLKVSNAQLPKNRAGWADSDRGRGRGGDRGGRGRGDWRGRGRSSGSSYPPRGASSRGRGGDEGYERPRGRGRGFRGRYNNPHSDYEQQGHRDYNPQEQGQGYEQYDTQYNYNPYDQQDSGYHGYDQGYQEPVYGDQGYDMRGNYEQNYSNYHGYGQPEYGQEEFGEWYRGGVTYPPNDPGYPPSESAYPYEEQDPYRQVQWAVEQYSQSHRPPVSPGEERRFPLPQGETRPTGQQPPYIDQPTPATAGYGGGSSQEYYEGGPPAKQPISEYVAPFPNASPARPAQGGRRPPMLPTPGGGDIEMGQWNAPKPSAAPNPRDMFKPPNNYGVDMSSAGEDNSMNSPSMKTGFPDSKSLSDILTYASRATTGAAASSASGPTIYYNPPREATASKPSQTGASYPPQPRDAYARAEPEGAPPGYKRDRSPLGVDYHSGEGYLQSGRAPLQTGAGEHPTGRAEPPGYTDQYATGNMYQEGYKVTRDPPPREEFSRNGSYPYSSRPSEHRDNSGRTSEREYSSSKRPYEREREYGHAAVGTIPLNSYQKERREKDEYSAGHATAASSSSSSSSAVRGGERRDAVPRSFNKHVR